MKKVGQIFREGVVNRIRSDVEASNSVFVVSYSAISGLKMADLRKSLRASGARMNVARNSVIKVAFKGLDYPELAEKVSNRSTALVYTEAEAPAVSKALLEFAKEIETITVEGGLLDGRVLEPADVKRLADLPSKDVLFAMLLGTIQAPLTRLASALNAKSRDLLSILKQLSEKKGGNEHV